MKSYFALLLLVFSLAIHARDRMTPEDYIEKYKGDAIKEMKRAGVPASITLAQGILESEFGNSRLARKANNHFGIKCHSDWSGPTIHKNDDAKNECFRKYKNAWESYRDHSNFLKNKKRYAFLFDYKITNYKAWAKGLKKAGYATNPKYPRLLIDLIERYDLSKYDNKKYKAKKEKDKKKEDKTEKNTEKNFEKDSGKKSHPGSSSTSKSRIKVSSNYVKYIKIKKGDTFYQLERITGIRKKRLLKYNERSGDNLRLGERIYLQPKKKNSTVKFYTVKPGDNLYTISQAHAVTLESIRKRNNLTSDSVKVGQQLKLKGRKIK